MDKGEDARVVWQTVQAVLSAWGRSCMRYAKAIGHDVQVGPVPRDPLCDATPRALTVRGPARCGPSGLLCLSKRLKIGLDRHNVQTDKTALWPYQALRDGPCARASSDLYVSLDTGRLWKTYI